MLTFQNFVFWLVFVSGFFSPDFVFSATSNRPPDELYLGGINRQVSCTHTHIHMLFEIYVGGINRQVSCTHTHIHVIRDLRGRNHPTHTYTCYSRFTAVGGINRQVSYMCTYICMCI